MRSFLLLLFVCFFCSVDAHTPEAGSAAALVQNKGQWPGQVLYATDLPQGWLFLEQDGFTYNFLAPHLFSDEAGNGAVARLSTSDKGHAFRVRFVQANKEANITATGRLPVYHNYFTGNNPAKWVSQAALYQEVRYQQLFPQVDLRMYITHHSLKYDFILAPHATVGAIRLQVTGAEKLTLQNGRLHMQTSVNEVIEEKPYAYQLTGGTKKEVACSFTLQGNEVGFEITGAYNPGLPLVIDPELLFLSYSGSGSGISANCATADAAGNTYIASRALIPQYPATTGAYQVNARGGNVAISKLNANGTRLLYATYLGGSQLEYPQALIVNSQQELVVLGITSSTDFPVSQQAYRQSFAGGATDYFVAKLAANGATLLASTLLGGSELEGGNIGAIPGQLALDAADNVYIGGCTFSRDFPIVNGFQRTHGQGYDGIVCKMNSSLTTLAWSSYLGGSGEDLIYDIKVGASGSIYVAGSTGSSNFPVTADVLHRQLQGEKDGFIARLAATGDKLEAATYLGTQRSELIKYIDFDNNENVVAAGYTSGSYPITPGAYGTENGTGGYFIHKLSSVLGSTIFSTHLGNNTGDRAPTAFRVQGCDNIYLAGYALQASPLSADAQEREQKTMYVCHLRGDGRELIYGSYLGGTVSRTHVHLANTSLLTRQGTLYQVECTYSVDHPVTTGAYDSNHNRSTDGAVYKFQFTPVVLNDIQAEVVRPPASCAPYAVQFRNNTRNGTRYTWNFGDGTPESGEEAPVHRYQSPGTYRVQLIATNPASCRLSDTTTILVTVALPPEQVLPAELPYACNQPILLDAGNPGYAYRWSTGATTQTIAVTAPGRYTVETSLGNCQLTQTFTVTEPLPPVAAPNIFTPNGDGKNDTFRFLNMGSNARIKIYNRWGRLVYQHHNYQNDWDGGGITAGTYYYILESPDNCSTSKGWVEVVR